MHRSIVNTASLRQLHYFKSAEYLCLFLNSCPLVALLIFPPSNWHFAMNRSIVHHGVTLTGTEQTRRLQDQFPPLVVVAVKALYISERALVSVYLFKVPNLCSYQSSSDIQNESATLGGLRSVHPRRRFSCYSVSLRCPRALTLRETKYMDAT